MVVVSEENVCSKKCGCLMFNLISFRSLTMPKCQVMILSGLAVMQVIHKWAEDRFSIITGHNAALGLPIEH